MVSQFAFGVFFLSVFFFFWGGVAACWDLLVGLTQGMGVGKSSKEKVGALDEMGRALDFWDSLGLVEKI